MATSDVSQYGTSTKGEVQNITTRDDRKRGVHFGFDDQGVSRRRGQESHRCRLFLKENLREIPCCEKNGPSICEGMAHVCLEESNRTNSSAVHEG